VGRRSRASRRRKMTRLLAQAVGVARMGASRRCGFDAGNV
jgi:hypothetical protein